MKNKKLEQKLNSLKFGDKVEITLKDSRGTKQTSIGYFSEKKRYNHIAFVGKVYIFGHTLVKTPEKEWVAGMTNSYHGVLIKDIKILGYRK